MMNMALALAGQVCRNQAVKIFNSTETGQIKGLMEYLGRTRQSEENKNLID